MSKHQTNGFDVLELGTITHLPFACPGDIEDLYMAFPIGYVEIDDAEVDTKL